MKARHVNVAILLLVMFELASGIGSFLVGESNGRWLFWLHRAGGLALLVLLVWKAGIAARSYQRRGLTAGTLLSAFGGLLLIASLATGVLWATVGLPWVSLPGVGRWAGFNFHIAFSLLLIPLFLLHVGLRWSRPRRTDLASRRAVLRLMGLLAVGFAFWGAQEVLSILAGLSGSHRRFTGSREAGSFSGNRYPVTQWLTDRVRRVDRDRWRLRVRGEVEREQCLSYGQILALGGSVRRATLDCTGGWYTVQHWSGVPVDILLERSGVRSSARSLIVCSATGYTRRFSLGEANRLLLATHVGGQALSAGHGFPLRLVAPGRRGYAWVKWVVELEVSGDPAWLEPPLPPQ